MRTTFWIVVVVGVVFGAALTWSAPAPDPVSAAGVEPRPMADVVPLPAPLVRTTVKHASPDVGGHVDEWRSAAEAAQAELVAALRGGQSLTDDEIRARLEAVRDRFRSR